MGCIFYHRKMKRATHHTENINNCAILTMPEMFVFATGILFDQPHSHVDEALRALGPDYDYVTIHRPAIGRADDFPALVCSNVHCRAGADTFEEGIYFDDGCDASEIAEAREAGYHTCSWDAYHLTTVQIFAVLPRTYVLEGLSQFKDTPLWKQLQTRGKPGIFAMRYFLPS